MSSVFPPSTEDDRVAKWRFDRLREMGVSIADALRLQVRTDVDLHELEALIERGCSPEIAVRIVD